MIKVYRLTISNENCEYNLAVIYPILNRTTFYTLIMLGANVQQLIG